MTCAGRQKRDFVSLANVCSAIIHLTECNLNDVDSYLFNIGGNWAPSILEMSRKFAQRYAKLTGVLLEIKKYKDDKFSFSNSLDYSTEKLISIGFVPCKDNSVNQELDDLIRFCLENRV